MPMVKPMGWRWATGLVILTVTEMLMD